MAISLSGSLEITGSLTVTGGINMSGSIASSSYASNAELLDGRDSLTFANTGSNSFVGSQNINGAVAVTGSLTTTGVITAQSINVQQVTSSVVYSSGSNIFGNSVSNTQSMTGSVGITGSLAVNGVSTLQGALTGTSATFSGNIIFDTTDRGIVTNTTDGSDNKFVSINGGGARGSDRGAGINLFGNEASGTGRIDVNAGDVTGGVINLVTAGLNRLTVNRDGSTTLAGALSGTSATFSGVLSQSVGTSTSYLTTTAGSGLEIRSDGSTSADRNIRFTLGTTEQAIINNSGNLGLGIPSPETRLHLSGDLTQQTSLNSTSQFFLILRKSRGTIASPLTVNVNDEAGGILFAGYDGATWRTGAAIRARVQAVSAGSLSSNLEFYAGNGSPSAGVHVLTMRGDTQNVLIGTTTDIGRKLYVNDVMGARGYAIREASANRGAFTTYNLVLGSGTDYSIGIFSEGEIYMAPGGAATKSFTMTTAGAATFSGALTMSAYSFASSAIQFTRATTDTISPASGNGILIFAGGNAQIRMGTANSINFDVNNSGNPFAALSIRQNGNTVSINSPDNNLMLELRYQNVASGYLGAIGSALYAYSVNGGYTLLNSSSAWVPASDAKRKRNFETYSNGLASILGLQPKLYNMDFQKDGDEKQVGLIAQEVKQFIPKAYNENGDFIGLDYNAIIVTMVNAIKEQQAQIEELKLLIN